MATVKRELRRAEKITDEARKAMEGTKLANKVTFHDELTNFDDPQDQVRRIQEELAKPKAKRGRKPGVKRTAPKPDKLVISEFMKIKHTFMKACKEAQDMFDKWRGDELKPNKPDLRIVSSQ